MANAFVCCILGLWVCYVHGGWYQLSSRLRVCSGVWFGVNVNWTKTTLGFVLLDFGVSGLTCYYHFLFGRRFMIMLSMNLFWLTSSVLLSSMTECVCAENVLVFNVNWPSWVCTGLLPKVSTDRNARAVTSRNSSQTLQLWIRWLFWEQWKHHEWVGPIEELDNGSTN